MRMYDIIEKKRDGMTLTKEEINFFIHNYTKDLIPDYQVSALLMAIYLNGMNEEETFNMTKSMIDSGDIFHMSGINGKIIDKHSTGGVGDTVTLVLGPMIAACGIPFAKMSGKGLGHTGGTIDKLQAIKGINLELNYEDFINNINNINISIVSQTGNIAPADKKIYGLRDVTATVDSIPLIASSIMSKKLAIKSDGIVFDVKLGSGAFMKNLDDAIELSNELVRIGKAYGRDTTALITNMDEPLGYAVGNNLEVIEAIETLKGNGPEDLYELCIVLGIEILLLSGKFKKREQARMELEEVIENKKAYNKLIEMVELQGGDSLYIKDTQLLDKGKYSMEIRSKEEGYIKSIDAEDIGKASLILGAGREDMSSEIDLAAGILLNKKVNDKVLINEKIITLYTNDKSSLLEAKKKIEQSFIISKKANNNKKLIYKRIV